MTLDAGALLLEKLRRDRDAGAIRAAVLAQFEIVTDRKERLSRVTVYDAVAAQLGVKVQSNMFRVSVMRVVRALGAVPIVPFNRRIFACIRLRSRPVKEWSPPRRFNDREIGKLRSRWYARLRADGFEDIETASAKGGGLKKGVSQRALEIPGWWDIRGQINQAYFEARAAAYWQLREAMDIWALYVIECLTIRQIEERTGLGRDKVHRTLRTFENWMQAGRPGLVEETSADGKGEGPSEVGDIGDF